MYTKHVTLGLIAASTFEVLRRLSTRLCLHSLLLAFVRPYKLLFASNYIEANGESSDESSDESGDESGDGPNNESSDQSSDQSNDEFTTCRAPSSLSNEIDVIEYPIGATLPRRACFVLGEPDQRPPEEPLLDQTIDEDRFLLFPIRHRDIFDLYKLQVAQFWTAEEINLSKDVADWETLTPVERNFFKRILAFFAPSDGIVGENLITRFYNDVGYTEARYFYVFQAMMENIHAEVYGLLIKNLIPDDDEQQELFRAFSTTPGIVEKVDWAKYWLDSDRSFAERLVAFAVVEGLLFSGSFASIFWLKKKGLLPGLTFSNELISRDEGLHCDFACHLYKHHIVRHLDDERVREIVRGAVCAERIFFTTAFAPGPVGEMNKDSMLRYVEFCADRLLAALGVEPLYHAENPFEFMHLISLDGRTNFFERRVGEYRQSMVSTNNLSSDMISLPVGKINLSDDF